MTKDEVRKWAEERKLTKDDIEFYDYVLGTPDEECFFCKEVTVIAGFVFWPDDDVPNICQACKDMFPDPPKRAE